MKQLKDFNEAFAKMEQYLKQKENDRDDANWWKRGENQD